MTQDESPSRETFRARRNTARARRREYRFALAAGLCAVWASLASVAAWHLYHEPPQLQTVGSQSELLQAFEVLDGILFRVAGDIEEAADTAPRFAATLASIERSYAELARTTSRGGPVGLRSNAEVFLRLSSAHLALGEPARAAAAAAAGRAYLAQLDPATPADRNRMAFAYIAEGDALLAQGRAEDAAAVFAEGAAIHGALSAAAPNDTEALRRLSIAYEREAQALAASGEHEFAGSRFQQSLAIRQQLVATEGDAKPERLHALAVAHSNLGDHASRTGAPSVAIDHYRRAMEMFDQLIDRQPDEPAWQDGRALHLARLGRVGAMSGEFSGLAALEEAAEAYSVLIEQEPEARRWQVRLAELLVWIGDIGWDRHDLPAARSAYTRALDIRRLHAERLPVDPDLVRAYADTLSRLARVDHAENVEAVAQLRVAEAIGLRRQVLASDPDNAARAAELAEALTVGAELGVDPQAHLTEALDVLARFAEGGGMLVKHKSLADDIRQRLASYTQ